VGLERLVDLDKADDFMGRDALRRISEEGVRRKLVGVEIDGEPLRFNDARWPVWSDGSAVGAVTSALYSPRLEKNIGYAWLPVELSEIGTSVIVGTPAGKAGATVVAKPFVDPKKEIPKS
jgi:glycine cleavage system aminomethyltransferase T